MGDRNNPIKFGPEWLRNLAREHSNSRSEGNNTTGPGPSGTGGASGATGGQPNSRNSRLTSHTMSNMSSKVLLAKLRYGREEMLALYEPTAEAPPELQNIDILYQPRPKPPLALNNSFEDEMRDARNIPPTGSMSSNDRFTSGRGGNRAGMDGRGKNRGSYVRQTSSGRGSSGGWHPINARLPTFTSGPDEESNPTRPWNNNSQHAIPNRNNSEQPDWTNKVFRSKRSGNHTNWRQQHSRDDGDEWRAEPGRSRQQPDKWERDWGDRSNQAERQPWTSNRRSWVSGEPHNNDDLPEWAVENSEACGGTFDSSGAFHGYSNDDSNLPKNQEVYPLTRSHTHGSFVRQKPGEEVSDDWWASEKAKKLSPKRFDASDIKFKKPSTGIPEKPGPNNSKAAPRDEPLQEIPEKLQPEKPAATPEPPEGNNSAHDTDIFNKNNTFKQQFSESKTFDALMRSDINVEEASDERGNFQSVMITPNNSLRQKHQNMVPAVCDGPKLLSRHEILQMMQANSVNQHNMEMENMMQKSQKSAEESILDELMDMKLDDKDIMPKMSMVGNQQMMSNSNQPGSGMTSGMASAGNMIPMQNVPMQQMHLSNPGLAGNHNQGMVLNSHPNMNMAPGMQGMGMQSIGITNSALNASLGLSIGPNMGLPMQGVPPPAMPNNMGPAGMQPGIQQVGRGRLPNFSSSVGMPGMPGMPAANMGNRALFLRQNPANNIQLPSDIPMPNHRAQSNMFPNHGLQHPGNQGQMFGNSMYGNMMHQSPGNVSPGPQNLAEQWYYEDPKKTIQGPFSSKEMFNWYRAGFFSPALMVRRACEVGMRPLGSYGPLVPFAQMDMMPPFPMSGGFEPRPQQHENILPPQQGLGGMDMNIGNMNMSDNSSMDSIQFGSVGLMGNPPFPQPPQMMDSLWGQPSTPTELLWMQQAMQNSRTDARVNNLAMFLWDQQPNTNSNSIIQEVMVKDMKTEDQILAQLRAQSIGTPQNMDPRNINSPPTLSFIADPLIPPMAPAASQLPKPDDSYLTNLSVTPNLEELEKLLQNQSLPVANPGVVMPDIAEPTPIPVPQAKPEKPNKTEQVLPEPVAVKPQNVQKVSESKTKVKAEAEKAPKNKENSVTKTKTKKSKEEKKEDVADMKPKEEEVAKVEKKVEEEEKRASSKSKKEEKASAKKEVDKEKKEWIKDGFTIVKGAEKSANKENKKKADEAKVAEEAERKRKEEEKLAVEEDKKKKPAESTKKQQEQQQRQLESVLKKAPWSVVSTQALQMTIKEPTLAEIQRLEREKKLEQIKEQQHMMQIIAQQQAAALAREQEMQAGLAWAKKMANTVVSPSQSLAEIQAEARKQSVAAAVAAAAAAAAQAQEEAEVAAPPPTNNVPWASSASANGGGFWDTQPNQPPKQEKAPEPPKIVEPVKTKKKVAPIILTKKEVTPAIEFETWCTTVLTSYSTKIDVPTFIGFLKDIESPYDVRDYAKCYLGDTKDSNDFARQFLERRSKMIRGGMITPSDDLCSPAIAVNPRTVSGSDYQEVKGKGKKTKKNKMMKIDARILGFSVTASEDRINVGDIDSV